MAKKYFLQKLAKFPDLPPTASPAEIGNAVYRSAYEGLTNPQGEFKYGPLGGFVRAREVADAFESAAPDLRNNNNPAGQIMALSALVNKARQKEIDVRTELGEERAAENNLYMSAKTRGPSYLASTIAAALVGRLISGEEHKWLGYGLGSLAGLGLNFARRKAFYGKNVTY